MDLFRRYRFLLLILTLVTLAGLYELTAPTSDSVQRELSTTMAELFPDSAEILYLKALTAYRNGYQKEADILFRKAIATEVKSSEDLLYNYAIFLIRTDADQQEIDQAIAKWKYNFPFSTNPEPSADTPFISTQR